MPSSACALLVATVLASNAVPVDVPPRAPGAPRLYTLTFDWTRDGLFTSALALALTQSALLKRSMGPDTCVLCDRTARGADMLNAADRWGRNLLVGRSVRARRLASNVSDVLNNALLPVGVMGAEYLMVSESTAPLLWLGEDALIIGEAVLLSTFTNQAVKYSMGRVRPYAHAAWRRRSLPAGLPVDDHLSFYSGHTSYAFSLVVATGMVAELRGYAGRSRVWAVGLPLAMTVGLLRIVGDKHYLTDVLMGMVAGATFGVTVPLLFHGRQRPFRDVSLQVVATPGGTAVVGQF